jgi:hypothetical protein
MPGGMLMTEKSPSRFAAELTDVFSSIILAPTKGGAVALSTVFPTVFPVVCAKVDSTQDIGE